MVKMLRVYHCPRLAELILLVHSQIILQVLHILIDTPPILVDLFRYDVGSISFVC